MRGERCAKQRVDVVAIIIRIGPPGRAFAV